MTRLCIPRMLLRQNLTVARDHGKQIVEVMLDSPCQGADRFHFLSLAELLFEGFPLSHILGNHFEDFRPFALVPPAAAAPTNSNQAAVFLPPMGFYCFKPPAP